uniref:Predicted protein n=1 Tax=Hordeum vulgare subsp. vulgare TaxID=112509 RepID=F2D834_HORVV|nr:predicted protein [Hordeum vulgare subsp. vulgare]
MSLRQIKPEPRATKFRRSSAISGELSVLHLYILLKKRTGISH